jgi:hypothetical protein
MQPLYLTRIEDLGRSDLVQVDCAACDRVALLTPSRCGSGSILSSRCSISNRGSDAAGAERKGGLSFRSIGGARAGEAAPALGTSERVATGAADRVN